MAENDVTSLDVDFERIFNLNLTVPGQFDHEDYLPLQFIYKRPAVKNLSDLCLRLNQGYHVSLSYFSPSI